MASNIDEIIRRIISDIRVEYKDEFDRNFSRQAFFSQAWQRRKSPLRPGGAILIDTGALRRSFNVETTGSTITFSYTKEYAEIHNTGGTLTVTAKMKRFFWAKYYSSVGSFDRKKSGEKSGNKRTVQLSTEAEFWKYMALKKVGSKIVIPRRQFVGMDPVVEATVKVIIAENLTQYFNNEYKII